MNCAKQLVRMGIRLFQDPREIVIVDAVVNHSCLRDDDLAYIARLNTKDLHKVVAKLKEARFLSQHNRPEIREGQTRPITRIYYYIDYHDVINTFKWRVHVMSEAVNAEAEAVGEKKEYFCQYCKSEWTQLEVLDHFGPDGFLCHACNKPLLHDLDRNSAGHTKAKRFNEQFAFMTDLLQKIDEQKIPANDFETAMSHAKPVIRDANDPGTKSIPVELGVNRPTAVKGLTNIGPKSMAVNISTSEGPTEAEKEAELARKEKIAQQNALPSWMSNSTVTGESFSGSSGPASALPKQDAPERKENPVANQDNQAMDDILASLQAEQAQKELEEDEYGSDDDDDDEDFEDVVATGDTTAGNTPLAAGPGLAAANGSGQASHKLRERENPADATDVLLPAPKRAKIASPVAAGHDEESESEEDIEFEDV